jgi:RecB family endonuclease NucS
MLFIKQQNNLTQINETTYDKEDQMQQYIYENPQILPVEELTGNKKLLVLIRELSTNYGRLDGLGIDEAGNVYIIETKLLRNPDRRNIIAQLLDYGVALWTEYKDPQELINYLTSKNINIKQSILDTFQTSEELADIIIENFKQNIKQ